MNDINEKFKNSLNNNVGVSLRDKFRNNIDDVLKYSIDECLWNNCPNDVAHFIACNLNYVVSFKKSFDGAWLA